MAKKNFKKGLGSLIQDTRKKTKKESNETVTEDKKIEEKKPTSDIEHLEIQIQRMSRELHKWRTGKLTPSLFEDSLKKDNLKYNPVTNGFEKAENN